MKVHILSDSNISFSIFRYFVVTLFQDKTIGSKKEDDLLVTLFLFGTVECFFGYLMM